MKRFLRNPFVYLMFIATLSACATTQLTSVWKDPSYQGHPAKVMVVGVARKSVNRRVFEDEFVRQLKAHGTDAIASYTVIPDNEQDNHEAIAAKVTEMGIDTVLITRLMNKKIKRVYVPGTPYFPPPYYSSWPDYYGYGYRYMYTPGYIEENEYAVMETNLYQASNNQLIWATASETDVSGSAPETINSYVGVMVENMVKQGLLGK